MLSFIVGCILAVSLPLDTNTVTGMVVDKAGKPVPGARVFLEPGPGGGLREGVLDEDGAFRFDDLPLEIAGVFAVAPGHGFAGRSVRVNLIDPVSPFTIVLPPTDTLSGRILNAQGKPVADARIIGLGLLGQHPVGIPLTKLGSFGFGLPRSGERGQYEISQLPAGETIALKIAHSDYASEGVAGAKVGDKDFRIALYEGVIVQGSVLSRERRIPVTNAAILITNAQPPFNTAIAKTDDTGAFALRLKPGVYICRALGPGMRSAGGEELRITSSSAQPRVKLLVAGTGYIHGAVKDVTNDVPIGGARVALYTNGNRSAIARTGPSGEYRMAAMEGKHTLRLEFAPGYFPPNSQDTPVEVAQGRETEAPGLWLAPIPAYKLTVIDGDGLPVPGAVVSLVRPHQFGWRRADGEGTASLLVGTLPADGRIVGIAEHPTLPRGALFAVNTQDGQNARVQLLPFSTVSGVTVDDRGRPLAGVVVGGALALDEFAPLVIWRCVSGDDGAFRWPGVVPGAPQRCMAWAGKEARGESAPFNTAPGERKSLGNLVIADGEDQKSLLGERLRWEQLPPITGPIPGRDGLAGKRALVVYCMAQEADMVIEGLERARELAGLPDVVFAVVVQGAYQREDGAIPVYAGAAPGQASTYLLDVDGRVRLETFGLPPLFALRGE